MEIAEPAQDFLRLCQMLSPLPGDVSISASPTLKLEEEEAEQQV